MSCKLIPRRRQALGGRPAAKQQRVRERRVPGYMRVQRHGRTQLRQHAGAPLRPCGLRVSMALQGGLPGTQLGFDRRLQTSRNL